jgi:DUF2075 family protein/predicted GIY-YIG superfamily endonuclease
MENQTNITKSEKKLMNMPKIKQFDFPINENDIKNVEYTQNWPVVYVLSNSFYAYVGETYNLLQRLKTHQNTPEKRIFTKVHMIVDDEFNKSATLDIESALIKYMSADEKFIVTNKNDGLVNADYFQREFYLRKINSIWNEFRQRQIAQKDLIEIENSDIFKFSPYKSLSPDQLIIAESIKHEILFSQFENEKSILFINGLPGSGKTVLATYLAKFLVQSEEFENIKLALVVSMTSLRNTLKKVFSHVDGLSSSMVIGPSDLKKDYYDILLVDEAHRLRQRRAITSYAAFDNKNIAFGFSQTGNELDWIMHSAKNIVLFYDENQSIRPSDIDKEVFQKLNPKKKYTLSSQLRVKAGMEFVDYIKNIFHGKQEVKKRFPNYDALIVDDFKTFYHIIREKNAKEGLSLLASGYSFEWVSKKNPKAYDICIDGIDLKWNSTSNNFIYSKNALNEVGCIHTLQGYELNYIGVIIGKDIDVNLKTNQIVINPDLYYDRNGKATTNYHELLKYIINIYVTLCTRGVYGVYFYVMNPDFKNYLSRYFDVLTHNI